MCSHAAFILLTFVGSALCWWPLSIEPNLELPWWVPVACVALGVFLPTVLCPEAWLWFPVASAIGSFSGLCASYRIWWPSDPIAGPWVPISVAVNTGLAAIVALVAGSMGRRVRLYNTTHRRVGWLAFAGCVAFGPAVLALTPPLVAHRIALHDRAAAETFKSLKKAVRQTVSDPKDQLSLCDGEALKRHFSGPQFSDEDWHRITANYVKQDGYFFMVYCREQGGLLAGM